MRLAPEYAAWLASSDNWLAARAALADAEPASPVRLVSPLPGTIYFLDPDLPDAGRHVRLRADGPAGIVWQSDSLECRRDRGETVAILTAGNHRLTALHPTTGARAETWIVVKQL